MERIVHKIDASGQTLGRLATQIAVLLRGKGKPGFLRHIDLGDTVEVSNIGNLKFSGKKLQQKIYWRHSGHLGGLKGMKLKDKLEKNPGDILRQAVYGMLPKNRTRDKVIKRLKIYKEEKE